MTLWLRVQAPFAAFRWLQAGVHRATSPVIPPSTAWGLLLNLAHVETRAAEDGVTEVELARRIGVDRANTLRRWLGK